MPHHTVSPTSWGQNVPWAASKYLNNSSVVFQTTVTASTSLVINMMSPSWKSERWIMRKENKDLPWQDGRLQITVHVILSPCQNVKASFTMQWTKTKQSCWTTSEKHWLRTVTWCMMHNCSCWISYLVRRYSPDAYPRCICSTVSEATDGLYVMAIYRLQRYRHRRDTVIMMCK